MATKLPKLRLLIATGIYPPQIGGPATYTALLERELPKHDIEVRVASFSSIGAYPGPIQALLFAFHLIKKARGVDVVLALDPASTGLVAAIISKLLRKRFLLRLGGDYAWEMASLRYRITETPDEYVNKMAEYPKDIRRLRKIEAFVARSADKVFTQCQYLKDVIAKWGIDKKKIVIIPNGFAASEKLAEKTLLRNMMHIEEGKIAISVGRLIPLKGFVPLVQVVPRILEKHPEFRLIIVGDGEEREHIEQAIKELGLEEVVSLTGLLEKEVLLRYIKAADLFVLNAQHETFSNLLLEAMAVGTPIVTTDRGGNPEMIEHEKEGILVPFGDDDALVAAINHCFDDKKKREQYALLAKEKVKEFSIERGVGALVKELLV